MKHSGKRAQPGKLAENLAADCSTAATGRPINARGSGNCTVCGTTNGGRLYHQHEEGVICEHCFLHARKHKAGLVDTHPYEAFVESLVTTLDLREQLTGLHSRRVASHTLILARHHFHDPETLREIYWGSLLHDIGKVGIPDTILLKPEKLTAVEWTVMQRHPTYGAEILGKLPFFKQAAQIVLCHEERFDGTGYPGQLKGEEIPLAARLFAVIDTLDAMTFDRPYRKALSFDTAKAEILRMSGSQFDPIAVETLIHEESALREMTALDYLSGGYE